MILAYILGLITIPALYGIYKAFQIFVYPNDMESIIERMDYEDDRVRREAIAKSKNKVRMN